MHQSDPSLGELSFELLAEIAVGATATIELCRVVDGRLGGELVAVKRLHTHIAEDPQFMDMFRDEVWMTAALKHPHVVEVVGWGQDARGPWFAVEFVRGVSLQRLMKTVFETGERFTERMVVYLARTVCDGLAEAHALRASDGSHLNLVHRDLTPGNILLGFDGHVKITDFGLAKAKQRLTKTLTGLLKGQPQYMSPELVKGLPLDGRSDIFALGVVLFELFTGRRPWNAASDLDAMRAITDDEPADLLKLRPKIDKALVEVVNRCLQKRPENRFQSALELRNRFQQWLDAHGYRSDNHVSLARFVRRNAMRQMRWFERAIAGEFADDARAVHAQQVLAQPVRARPSSPRSEDKTRDERPSGRGVPPVRAEAKTRKTIEGHRDPDSIDWGDDGPTLVQKSKGAREMIQRARRRAESKMRRDGVVSSVPEADTTRRKLKGPRRRHAFDSIEEEDSSEAATTVGRTADVAKEIARHAESDDDADATVQLAEAGARVQQLLDDAQADLGVVAPHDPNVPPVPSTSPTAKRKPPLPAARGRGVDSTTRMPVDDVETEAVDRPSRPVMHTHPIASPIEDPVIQALPAPRFPSDPSLSGEVLSTDFSSEAARLSRLAMRQKEMSAAAQRAAKLAAEASVLAAAGQQHRALQQLREAQAIGEDLVNGEVPEGDWNEELSELELPSMSHPLVTKLIDLLRTRQGVTIVALGVAALLLMTLLVGAMIF